MNFFSLNLIVFATVFLLSFALPEDKGKDHYKTLIESEKFKENAQSLQRKKPPGKVPGPTLSSEEQDIGSLDSTHLHKESKAKRLFDEDKRKKGKKDTSLKKYNKNIKKDDLGRDSKNEEGNSSKDPAPLTGSRYNSDWKEETQEEKSNIH